MRLTKLLVWCLPLGALPLLLGIHGPFLLDDLPNLEFARLAGDDWLSWYRAILGNESGQLRRPLANLSFLLNLRLFGPEAMGFKVVNIALHGLIVWLVYLFCARLLRLLLPHQSAAGGQALALGAAAIWVLHPLQVSTGLYVVQRMTQISAAGTLAALVVALGFLAKPAASRREAITALAMVAGIALIGLMGKETAALTPLLLLVIIACIPKREAARTQAGYRWFVGLGVFLPVALLLVAAAYSLVGIEAHYLYRPFSLAERLFTQPFILGHYLSTIFIPDIRKMGLYLDGLPVQTAWSLKAWLGTASLLAIFIGAIWQRRRWPLPAFCVLWFLACHALESTFLPLEMAFEHRNYLALIGPALLIARGAQQLGALLRPSLHRALILAGLAVLTVTTASRAHQWGEPARFIRMEAQHHPTSPRALNSIASLEFEQGNLAAARDAVQRMEQLFPHSFWANALHLNLLACTDTPGVPEYDRLLEIARSRPLDRHISSALISVLTNVVRHRCGNLEPSQLDAFMRDLAATLRSPADLEKVHILRAMLAGHLGLTERHREHLQAAVAANPRGIEARLLLGYLYLNAGELDAASAQTDALRRVIGRGPEIGRVRELERYIESERAGASH